MSLRKQIEDAKRRLADLPQWVSNLMWWEGGDRTGLNQPTQGKEVKP